MSAWIVATREIKLGFRNPWAYSFLLLFTVFSLALQLIQATQGTANDYTHTTGTLLNLILYLLPLMTLLLGSFAVTAEKEEGGWQLLSTYPLSTLSFLLGKYIGLSIVLGAIVAFGFGFSGMVGALFGHALSLSTMAFFLAFSLLIVFLFLGIAIWVGTMSKNRWQALTIGVSLWFFFIIGWSTVLIAVLSRLPYPWIQPSLVGLTFLNPAELVRVFMVVKMGGGAVFGPDYYMWIKWIRQPAGTWWFAVVCCLWITVMMGTAVAAWEGRRGRD